MALPLNKEKPPLSERGLFCLPMYQSEQMLAAKSRVLAAQTAFVSPSDAAA